MTHTVKPSRDKIYTDDVVFTSDVELVQLDADYRKFVGILPKKTDDKADTPHLSIEKITRAVLTVADAILTTAWGDTWNQKTTKWMPAGAFKAALALVDIFGPTEKEAQLSISDIQIAVQEIIDQNEARLGVGDVTTVSDWLNKYVMKSRDLAAKNPDLSAVDLSEYDKKQFVIDLKDIQGGRTAFRHTMDVYRLNRDIRKYAIPTYLLGMMLHLHVEVLALLVKKETTPVDAADIAAVVKLAKDYQATIPQLEEDYVLLCQALYDKHRLMYNLYDVGKTNVQVAYNPEPKEGVALGNAAVMKYLQGDRMIIERTGWKLNDFINHVPTL